jgi:hypothetical protein
VPSGGVTLKRRCTYRPSVIYLVVNKLLSLSLSLSLSRVRVCVSEKALVCCWDTCVSCEEEDTCVSYEEEDTCVCCWDTIKALCIVCLPHISTHTHTPHGTVSFVPIVFVLVLCTHMQTDTRTLTCLRETRHPNTQQKNTKTQTTNSNKRPVDAK